MSVMLIADHNRHRHASRAQGNKSNRCALTLSPLATTVRHIADRLLHVIIMLCLVHTLHKDKARHRRRLNNSYKLLLLPMVPSVCQTLTMAAVVPHHQTPYHPRLIMA